VCGAVHSPEPEPIPRHPLAQDIQQVHQGHQQDHPEILHARLT
jgi:hypothetical protein